ncbi:uncharacterized protein LOC121734775 [Aricia agestis]|uniref:uncharacterized protein LOC121734775 n=1 Tax=Aricia agestis TaxID=91739 RepID=UPI001C20311D|nr:uncharacterized protein LOC121734775 [Aricia agestis]
MYSIRLIVLFCIIFASYGSNFKEVFTGFFREKDLVVANDRFYRPRIPFKRVFDYYYKKVECPISYIKVTDRLGVSPGPTAEIVKGGLRSDYVVLLMGSAYNRPIFVNVFITCAVYDEAQNATAD